MPTTGFQVNGSDVSNYFVPKDNFIQGGAWIWGNNGAGELGINDVTWRSSPVQTISGGSNWKQVFIGSSISAAIKTDGTLWLWGENQNGAIGNNTSGNKYSSPVQTVAGGTNWKQVSVGNAVMAIKTDGTLWGWGRNYYGETGVGDAAFTNRSSPVQVGLLANWRFVSCGPVNGGAIRTDGTLWMWGSNSYGELGDGTTANKSSPVQTVSGGTNWKQISVGYSRIAAIKTDGTLWTWGLNSSGEIGDNTIVSKSSPVQTVAGGTNWKYVSAGKGGSTAGIKTDGTLWTWGDNSNGVLAIGGSTFRSSPVQVAVGGTNWKQISVGAGNMGAVKTDGTLWMWGYNAYGIIGNNNTFNTSTPTQTAATGTNWKEVIVGGTNTVGAIRENFH